MSATGNMSRSLSEAEQKLTGKAAANFMREMGQHPRELTVYALSTIITFMANNSEVAELDIIAELGALSRLPIKR